MPCVCFDAMNQKPAVLITDEVNLLLQTHAVQQASFQQLTGVNHVWEVDSIRFGAMTAKLAALEIGLRNKQPDKNITCFITDTGAYWLTQAGIDLLGKAMEAVQKILVKEGPLPVWHCTSAELFTSHVANMRRLLMAAAHDLVLIDSLKEALGSNHPFMNREFETCKNSIHKMRDAIMKEAPAYSHVTSEDIVMFERCRITFDLLDKKEKSEDELGYNVEKLKKAQTILDRRCIQAMPNFQGFMNRVSGELKDSLRRGESVQLNRASKWELTFNLMDVIPDRYRGQAHLATLERKGLSSFVASRENELGQSSFGQETLAETSKVVRAIEEGTVVDLLEPPLGAALTDEQIRMLLAPKDAALPPDQTATSSSEAARKKAADLKRMAFQKRTR